MNWKKLHDDLLLETEGRRKGKYSRKSVTLVSSLVMAIVSGLYILLAHLFSDRGVDGQATTVFLGFLSSAVGTNYFTNQDKKNHMMHDNQKPDIIE